MLLNEDNIKKLIHLGQFKDKSLEVNYIENKFESMKKIARPMILILAFILIVFVVPDIMFNTSSTSTIIVASLRIGLFVYLIYLYFSIRRTQHYKKYYQQITIAEFVVGITYILIISHYDNPNFLLQLLSLMLVILSFNIVPNKLHYSVFASFTIWIVFLVLATQRFHNLMLNEFIAAMVFPQLFLGTVVTYNVVLDSERRVEYILKNQAKELAIKDCLTKIYNRFKFDKELTSEIQKYQTQKNTFSVVMFDIDDFKKINDTFGHLFGDIILIQLADTVSKVIRQTDIFARWGGEEFAIILPGTDLNAAKELTMKIKESIVNNNFIDQVQITCSFGVTSIQENDNIDTLIKRVDNLLYKAKDDGKNLICC